MRRSAALAVILLLPACSLAVTGPRPRAPATETPRCDRSAAGPIFGDVLATLFVSGFGFMVGTGHCVGEYEECTDSEFFGSGFLVAGILSVPFVVAMYSGHEAASDCRVAWRRHEAALAAGLRPTLPARPPPPNPAPRRGIKP